MRLLNAALLLCAAGSARAGTAMIEIQTEGSGEIIDSVNGDKNLNGAMVWDGSKWVVNSTWAHKFFVDTRDGSRLKTPTLTTFQGNQAGTVTTPYSGVALTRSLYT